MICFQRTIDAAKYCEQFDYFREASIEALRIGQQEGRDFSLRQPDHTHLCTLAKNYSSFLGMFCCTFCIVLTLLHQIIISSALFKILLMEKIFGCHQNLP